MSVAVIADDLTSALDGAGPFAGGALAVDVVLGSRTSDADVVACDLDTRSGPATRAAMRVAAAVARHRGARALMKTVDSTLRGHLRIEIDAARATAGRAIAVVAPAFPAAGRTTRGGHQHVDGRPLQQTDFATDTRHPAMSGDLVAALSAQSWQPGAPIPATRLIVCDAESDADLDAAVATFGLEDVLWVGSPGLAAALARAHGLRPAPAAFAAARPAFVVGSQHAVNTAQLARLRTVAPATHIIAAPPAPPLVTAWQALRTARSLAAEAARAVADGADALFVSGGETARAVVDALGVQALDVLGEIEPGIVACRARASGLPLVVKAGGFGDEDLHVRLLARLAGATA